MELESFVEGEIEALLVEPGAKVAVGTPLARVRAAGEPAAPPRPTAPAPAAPAPAAPVAAPPPAPREAAPAPVPSAPSPAASVQAAPAVERVRGSPAARKRARELGIELASLHGTGPHGAIVLRDVVAPPAPPPPAAPPAVRRPPPPASGPVRDAIAAAMARSKREIPHYYLAHTISLKRAMAWLGELNAHRSIQDRMLPAVLLLRATALALWDVPELNGFWIDGAYRPSEEVHLGTAIALRTGGLIAPAILDADDKPLDRAHGRAARSGRPDPRGSAAQLRADVGDRHRDQPRRPGLRGGVAGDQPAAGRDRRVRRGPGAAVGRGRRGRALIRRCSRRSPRITASPTVIAVAVPRCDRPPAPGAGKL